MATVTVDGPTIGYVRKVKIGSETYNFSSRVEYQSNLSVKDQVTGATVQLPEKGTSKITQLYSPSPNVWVTSAVLGVDGKWVPLKKSESKDLLGNSYYPQSESNDYVLGASALKGLNSSGSNSLRSLSINDGKVLYNKVTGLSDQQVNSEFDVSSNVPPPGQPATPGLFGPAISPTDTGQTLSEAVKSITETKSKAFEGEGNRTYDLLHYPSDINTTQSDVIQFTMINYGTKSLSTTGRIGFGERTEETRYGTVTMSIQPSINDLNFVNWTPDTMNPLQMGAAGTSLEFVDTGDVSKSVDQLGKALGDPNLAKALGTLMAQEAAGTKGLLTRTTGAMFNNNLELLFQGPQLRQFTFNFKMSPRYKEEAEMVRKIIRFFKQGSAVQRTTTNLFLKAPNVFKIKYLDRGSASEHRSLNRIKTCALVSCGVDYTPTGSYMTYNEDNSMVSYTLSLTFNELEPVYADEYTQLDNGTPDSAGIGY